MNKSDNQRPGQARSQGHKSGHDKEPLDPVVDPVETEDQDAGEDTMEPAEPAKSDGMNDPSNPSDNTLASAGSYFDDTVNQQAGDDLEQLKLNPGDKGTQAHQGHVYHTMEDLHGASNPV